MQTMPSISGTYENFLALARIMLENSLCSFKGLFSDMAKGYE